MLNKRAGGHEFLDDPHAEPAFVARSHYFMEKVNCFLGGRRAVRQFLSRQLEQVDDEPLRVLDIGSGSADIPLALAETFSGRGHRVHFTCLESSSPAAAIARRSIARSSRDDVVLIQENVFAHVPERPYHCAVGSMFFHHLTDEEILDLLRHLRPHVQRAVLINDLWRHWVHYAGGWLLTLPTPRRLRHDALLSIRRGLRAGELRDLIEQLDGVAVRADNGWLFRVRAEIQFV